MSARLVFAVAITIVSSLSCARAVRPPSSPAMPRTAHAIVPAPVSVQPGDGEPFTVTPQTAILVRGSNDGAAAVGRYLARLVRTVEAPAPPRVETGVEAPRDGSIHLSLGAPAERVGDEGYELTVTTRQITLAAAGAAGLFYGVQTLRHLLPPSVEYEAPRRRTLRVAPVHIVDKPRFAWRGAMLDVARHFFTVEDVKRYIDLLALLKINRLHLHLSDDQGWRIEIKSWPNLATHGGSTEVGGGPGGFYTQEQFADVVAYAAERFITIVPEIDMPSHINAAMASYPELNCAGVAPPLYTGIEVGFSAMCVDKEITYTFLDDVVREISALAKGPYFHIGGDEVKKLTAEQYKRFIERAQTIVQSHGRHRPALAPEDDAEGRRFEGREVHPLTGRSDLPRHEVRQGDGAWPRLGRDRRGAPGVRLGAGNAVRGHPRVRDPRRRGAAVVGDRREHARRRVPRLPADRRRRGDRLDAGGLAAVGRLPRAHRPSGSALDGAGHQFLSVAASPLAGSLTRVFPVTPRVPLRLVWDVK
jgi:hypothetical protein